MEDSIYSAEMAIALEKGDSPTIPFARTNAGVRQPRADFQVQIEVKGKFNLKGVPDASDNSLWNFHFTPEHAQLLGSSERTYKMVLIHSNGHEQTLWRGPIQAMGFEQ